MAPPVKGLWAMRNSPVGPATNVWGTGINPVHMIYGEGPPIRVGGRADSTSGIAPGVAGNQYAPITPAAEGQEGYLTNPPDYGYMTEDLAGLDVFADPMAATQGIEHIDGDWPHLGTDTPDYRGTTGGRPSYNAPATFLDRLRSMRGGPRDGDQKVSNEIPVETVSEGWLNKARGVEDNAETSDPAQYERQTSMQQRNAVRSNKASQMRGTDDDRHPINSRTAGQKMKYYSGEEPGSNRYYDMSPFQQDQMPRPFRYRVAGTGYQEWLEANETYDIEAMRRTPPADPSLGIPETGPGSADFGYTSEDNFYA